MHSKQELTHPHSHSLTAPSILERISQRMVMNVLSRLKVGLLTVELPDRTQQSFGDPMSKLKATIQVSNPEFFWRVVRDGEIGFGDSYMDGHWSCDNLPDLLRLFVENRDHLDERSVGSLAGKAFHRIRHLWNRNHLLGSRKNIRAHYDLSNDLFKAFLDENMMYSCARFNAPDETLEVAQRNKNQSIIEKARLGPDDHVLEIGSGWGSFAIQAVQQTGCRVTTVTLSEEQFALATQRIAAAGLSNRIEVVLSDYRALTGSFDKIVSIEMFEAVGYEYFGTFFQTCDRLLKPNGLMVMQVITLPDQRFEAYRQSTEWLQKHIFPGGLVPSLTAMATAMTRDSQLVIEDAENIGIHYARTLREWRARFQANWAQIESLGFDLRFSRMWNYYLAYCEVGFQSRVLGTLQLVLTRPRNTALPSEV